jgi:DNA-binding TFAR19-related protein (PDSD5 family)
LQGHQQRHNQQEHLDQIQVEVILPEVVELERLMMVWVLVLPELAEQVEVQRVELMVHHLLMQPIPQAVEVEEVLHNTQVDLDLAVLVVPVS